MRAGFKLNACLMYSSHAGQLLLENLWNNPLFSDVVQYAGQLLLENLWYNLLFSDVVQLHSIPPPSMPFADVARVSYIAFAGMSMPATMTARNGRWSDHSHRSLSAMPLR